MKPSGIINTLKVSLILFVILQQKKEASSSLSGRDPGLGEDGGPGMGVPWAGMVASDGLPGQEEHKLESRLPAEISITSDMQMTPPLWQKVKRN